MWASIVPETADVDAHMSRPPDPLPSGSRPSRKAHEAGCLDPAPGRAIVIRSSHAEHQPAQSLSTEAEMPNIHAVRRRYNELRAQVDSKSKRLSPTRLRPNSFRVGSAV